MIKGIASSSRLRNCGLRRSIVGASALGGMGAALQTANGAIIYSGMKNLSTSSLIGTSDVPDVEPVDLSGHSSKGAEFSLYSFNSKGADFHLLSAPGGFDHFTPIVGATPGESGIVRKLATGTTIDSQGTFVSGFPTSLTVYSNVPNSQWSGGTDGYFGYRFDTLGPQPLYGWGHLKLSADAKVMTLVDWAYEDTGAPISVGVPEPTTSLLLAACLAIAALFGAAALARDRMSCEG